ncbi:GGDEF domain-containing protein [Eubacterium oxidoreducens]|uniref:Diguanylate cyclase (GGDEF) domain-containing protein n=1 Tax=Eubacterium oxidoreducens TaxID=1732 RepID=A0A1G6BIV2_EUBOX|nr:GGDEF domain-containing protein [Eubacterium oxidoreducens]SDB20524.1 diguanylate cyclase (GGDEF) domain-containing protein [Eubacterium oxidoreducens]
MKTPYTERYVRCYERTGASHSLLLDLETGNYQVQAADTTQTIRVGFPTDMQYMMNRNTTSGDMSGYGYDYLQNIAGYTGWKYEYVEGEWTELWNLFLNGEIDLLEDVSYTEERAEKMWFSSKSIGTEVYRLYVLANNTEVTSSNYRETLEGKTIGVTKDTYQEELLRQWVEDENIDCTVKGYASDSTRNELLGEGRLDAIVEIETAAHSTWTEIAEVGSSDFYIALSKDREDLLEDLNNAIDNIMEINPQYNEELYLKYLSTANISKKLSDTESEWIAQHDEIKVGIFDAQEELDVENVIKTLLKEVLNQLGLKDISISCIVYTSLDEMDEDLQEGKIDVMYPTFDELSLNEKKGISIVAEIEPVKISGVIPEGTSIDKAQKVGIIDSGLIQHYINTYYPNAEIVYYEDEGELLDAVMSNEVDAVFAEGITPSKVSSSSYNDSALSIIGNSRTYYKCMGVKQGNAGLLMLLERGVNQIDSEYIESLVDDNTRIQVQFSWEDFYKEHGGQITKWLIIGALIVILLIVIFFKVRGKKLLRISQTDTLTKILNRSGEQLIRDKMKQNIGGMFCLIDVDRFKWFNDSYGHDAGDQVLIEIAKGLTKVFRMDDILIRLGGDEFAVFVPCVVDEKMAQPILERLVKEIEAIQCEAVENNPIQISVGVAFFHPNDKIEFEGLYKKADEACYEGKKQEGCSYKVR